MPAEPNIYYAARYKLHRSYNATAYDALFPECHAPRDNFVYQSDHAKAQPADDKHRPVSVPSCHTLKSTVHYSAEEE
jgi:hypothetical protein